VTAPTSLNGWPVLAPGSKLLATKAIPGVNRRLTMRRDVLPLFLALAHDYDDWVRSIDTGARIDEGGYSYREARAADDWSNHASGTAMDLNWSEEGALNGAWGKAFFAKPANQADIQQILKVYKVVFWGGAWNRLKDYMHWEIMPSVSLAQVKARITFLGIDANGVRHNDWRGKPLKVPRRDAESPSFQRAANATRR